MSTPLSLPLHLPKEPGQKTTIGQLYGCAPSLVIAKAMEQHQGFCVVICSDTSTAQRVEQELAFFAEQNPDVPLISLPDWETLPYDNFSPHHDIISQRLNSLYQLPRVKRGILIVPIATAAHRLCPTQYIEKHSMVLRVGDNLSLQATRSSLEVNGYQCVSNVIGHGEFAVRGSLLDIFPMGSVYPYRVDLLGNEVDSIRTFDPETQRSIQKLDAIELLPAREFGLDEYSINLFRKNFRIKFEGDPQRCPLYQDISQGAAALGCEYYLPLFFEQLATLFDYLPSSTVLFSIGDNHQALENFWREVNERYEQYRHDRTRPILPPNELFLAVNEVFAQCKQFPLVQLQQQPVEPGAGRFNLDILPPPELFIESQLANPLHKLSAFLQQNNQRVLFCAESLGRQQALLELLQKVSIYPKHYATWPEFLAGDAPIAITVAPLELGLILETPRLVLISESQLFGQRVMQRRVRKQRYGDVTDQVIKNLAELHIDALIVHADHGIGRYKGLQILTVDKEGMEFLCLEYANQAKLYVPVSSLHLISRYSGDSEHITLTHLGSGQWEKAKRKAAEKIRDVAAELLNVYARRAARVGHAFPPPDSNYQLFAASFPFEETPDQQQAIEQVNKDLCSPQPMDRLVCGDVGFGKTEVAMRATFIAVEGNKQVAILVPTTLLAQQHYDNFRDRFAPWAVQIELLSRFRTAKAQLEAIEKINQGQVDIVIGTHKLLDEKIAFQRLGLLIIDEEHRFGVRQKERFKALRTEVDILTLTATPIPRTLNMALTGMRDLSIIATPPKRRLSVKTFVRERNTQLVREAIMREIMRGGQVYYLHNDIDTIGQTARHLSELVPEARIAIGHGQLRERELEHVMADFYHHQSNVLVCTTIIETGIDIPTANTIIIDRADKFGLAQLHQLRGRVGRSHHQAYAYLFTPPVKVLTSDAKKRLDAISALEDLGAGFTLATHDLEIRGAGELLGEEQSGNINAIGFSLYSQLLEQAITALKEGKEPDIDAPLYYGAEVDLQLPALIPEDYLPDVHARLVLYKRIASAQTMDELNDLRVEMIDRFGLLPIQTQYLFRISELKIVAKRMGVTKVEASAKGGRIEFSRDPHIKTEALIRLIQQQSQWYKLEGSQRLRFTMDLADREQRINKVDELLKELSLP